MADTLPRRTTRATDRCAAAIATMALTLVAATCSPPPAEFDDGPLVIVGGALRGDNADVYHAVLERRSGDGPFCVIPTASGAPERSMASSIERFGSYAADDRYAGTRRDVVGIWITEDSPEAAADPAIVDQLLSCSGFWFVGGQQSRIVRTFRPDAADTPAFAALMQRWREGAVVAGTSAGAAMMSSRSIGGGSPAEALAFGVTVEPDGDGVWVMRGLDFAPWAIVGQHHLARGRWGRLVVATLESQDVLGLGIDENTALVYDGGVAEVVGASGVLMVDVATAVPGEEPRTATGIRLELLASGDRVDVRTREVVRRRVGRTTVVPSFGDTTSRSAEDGAEPDGAPTIADISAEPFARWAFLHLLHAFATGAVTEATLDGGVRSLHLRLGDGFTAQVLAGTAVLEGPGTPAGLSLGPIELDVRR